MISQSSVTNWHFLFLLFVFFLFISQNSLASSDCSGKFQGETVSQSEVDQLLSLHAELLDELKKEKIQRSELFTDTRYLNLCGAVLDDMQFEGKNLRYANLQAAKLNKANFYLANLEDGNLQYIVANKAVFSFSNLENADLSFGELPGAYFNYSNMANTLLTFANLDDAELYNTDLEGAILNATSARNATFFSANLHQADLAQADFTGSLFRNAILTVASVDLANFTGAELGGAKGLRLLPLVEESLYPVGLYEQRNMLWASGFKQEARELNYLFQHHQIHARLSNEDVGSITELSILAWLNQYWDKFAALTAIIAFELTTDWGLAPSLALLELGIIIVLMGLVYWIGLLYQAKLFITRSVKSWSPEGEHFQEGDFYSVDVRRFLAEKSMSNTGYQINLFRISLYFSLVSAIHIGWKDFNLGTWVSRIQSEPYTFHAKGWARTVSGLQSLVCIYLIVIWALTQFSLFFE